MKRILRSRTAIASVVGLSLIGVLAGCASTTSTTSSDSSGTSAGTSSGSSSGSTGSTSDTTSSYKDGTYSSDATYLSPGGQEEVSVTITVKSNLITAVEVKTLKSEGEGARYQAQFESAISSVVVGKNLAGLGVSTVAGSSLTSEGFNSALNTIRSEAAA